MHILAALFGDPSHVAAKHTLTLKAHQLMVHTQAIPVGDMNLPQGTLDPNKIDPNPLNLGIQDTITSWLSTYFKDMTLLSLALILLGIGLYMLANSTKTGQAAIGAATKAAMA